MFIRKKENAFDKASSYITDKRTKKISTWLSIAFIFLFVLHFSVCIYQWTDNWFLNHTDHISNENPSPTKNINVAEKIFGAVILDYTCFLSNQAFVLQLCAVIYLLVPTKKPKSNILTIIATSALTIELVFFWLFGYIIPSDGNYLPFWRAWDSFIIDIDEHAIAPIIFLFIAAISFTTKTTNKKTNILQLAKYSWIFPACVSIIVISLNFIPLWYKWEGSWENGIYYHKYGYSIYGSITAINPNLNKESADNNASYVKLLLVPTFFVIIYFLNWLFLLLENKFAKKRN